MTEQRKKCCHNTWQMSSQPADLYCLTGVSDAQLLPCQQSLHQLYKARSHSSHRRMSSSRWCCQSQCGSLQEQIASVATLTLHVVIKQQLGPECLLMLVKIKRQIRAGLDIAQVQDTPQVQRQKTRRPALPAITRLSWLVTCRSTLLQAGSTQPRQMERDQQKTQ